MLKFKICILNTRLGGDLPGLMSPRIRAISEQRDFTNFDS